MWKRTELWGLIGSAEPWVIAGHLSRKSSHFLTSLILNGKTCAVEDSLIARGGWHVEHTCSVDSKSSKRDLSVGKHRTSSRSRSILAAVTFPGMLCRVKVSLRVCPWISRVARSLMFLFRLFFHSSLFYVLTFPRFASFTLHLLPPVINHLTCLSLWPWPW